MCSGGGWHSSPRAKTLHVAAVRQSSLCLPAPLSWYDLMPTIPPLKGLPSSVSHWKSMSLSKSLTCPVYSLAAPWPATTVMAVMAAKRTLSTHIGDSCCAVPGLEVQCDREFRRWCGSENTEKMAVTSEAHKNQTHDTQNIAHRHREELKHRGKTQ